MQRLIRLFGTWLALAVTAVSVAAKIPVVIAFDADNNTAANAAAMGMDEAVKQAKFLGIEYGFDMDKPENAGKHAEARAVILAGTSEQALAVADKLAAARVPVISVLSTDDELRTKCRPNLFHMAPSRKMLADAAAQWKKANPEDSNVVARAWHADFVKFSARQLNNRWVQRFSNPMPDEGWAMWAGVRLITDAIANNPEATPAELTKYLREEMEFDSYKGVYSTFRETGQLGQTLLIVVDGKLAGEAPVRGVAATDELDSLGLQECEGE